MNKALIVYNPMAGNEKGNELAELLKERLKEDFNQIDVRGTKDKGDATIFAQNSYKEGFHSVFVIGGDGTVNEVFKGLLSIEKENRPILGVIPGGTFNAVARVLQVNQVKNRAIKNFSLDKIKEMDMGLVNDSVFSLIFSIGDVPEAIHSVSNEEKTKFKMLAYAKNIIEKISDDSVYDLDIDIDGEEFSGLFHHVMILLSDKLENFELTEYKMSMDDGFLHAFLMPEASLTEKVGLLSDMAFKKSSDNENLIYRKAKSIKISSKKSVETDVDGDEGEYLPVSIKVEEKALKVYYQG